jgi:hypothetical protein
MSDDTDAPPRLPLALWLLNYCHPGLVNAYARAARVRRDEREAGDQKLVAVRPQECSRGESMEPAEHYPRRYRLRCFPDEASLAVIGPGEL